MSSYVWANKYQPYVFNETRRHWEENYWRLHCCSQEHPHLPIIHPWGPGSVAFELVDRYRTVPFDICNKYTRYLSRIACHCSFIVLIRGILKVKMRRLVLFPVLLFIVLSHTYTVIPKHFLYQSPFSSFLKSFLMSWFRNLEFILREQILDIPITIQKREFEFIGYLHYLRRLCKYQPPSLSRYVSHLSHISHSLSWI